jgi:hypothetical protein
VCIERQTSEPAWQVFATLEDLATALATDADERLAWQNAHPL